MRFSMRIMSTPDQSRVLDETLNEFLSARPRVVGMAHCKTLNLRRVVRPRAPSRFSVRVKEDSSPPGRHAVPLRPHIDATEDIPITPTAKVSDTIRNLLVGVINAQHAIFEFYRRSVVLHRNYAARCLQKFFGDPDRRRKKARLFHPARRNFCKDNAGLVIR